MWTECQILTVATPSGEGMDYSWYPSQRFGMKERYLILTLYL